MRKILFSLITILIILTFLIGGCVEQESVNLKRAPICNDGAKDSGEFCDADDLGGETCYSLVEGEGVLRCGSDCEFDASDCSCECQIWEDCTLEHKVYHGFDCPCANQEKPTSCGEKQKPQMEDITEKESCSQNTVLFTVCDDFDCAYKLTNEEYGYAVVCLSPCRLSEKLLKKRFNVIQTSYLKLENYLGVKVKEYADGVEVHIDEDNFCEQLEGDKCRAYAKTESYESGECGGVKSSLTSLCLFEKCYDYDVSSNVEESTIVHELAHAMWQHTKVPDYFSEGFSDVMMSLTSGSYLGYGDFINVVDGFCDEQFRHKTMNTKYGGYDASYNRGELLFYRLCKNTKFNVKHLPVFFKKLKQNSRFESYDITAKDVRIMIEETIAPYNEDAKGKVRESFKSSLSEAEFYEFYPEEASS